jgi:predicted helicase
VGEGDFLHAQAALSPCSFTLKNEILEVPVYIPPWPADLTTTMTALQTLLNTYRLASASEREKGSYFEDLIVCYLRHEATYRGLYSHVWPYAQWAKLQGIDQRDTGIDLVAKTHGTGEFHAIQCKLYAAQYRLQKSDIDSFFTASGKTIFSHRLIISTTRQWSEHALEAMRDQQPPVTQINLTDLENSQIDWSQCKPAIDWVLERQCVKIDKASTITNDANLWARHTMHNPRYPLELLQRVVSVSLETLKIVQALPALE